ncbi:MAG: ABC transporter permease [Planctomycetota bacterium]
MNPVFTILRRELFGLFCSPIGYVVLALFALGSSMVFYVGFAPGNHATMRVTYSGVVWLLVFLAPAISMRLLSEEMARGTLEKLMTGPVTDLQIVLGKWLAALAFFVVLLLPLLAHVAVLELTADPDPGPIVTGWVGLLFVGALYLAIGTFASAATENQIIAFLLTVFIICGLTFLLYFLPDAGFFSPRVRSALYYANVNRQFEDFNKGLIDLRNFVYFASATAFFLFLAVKLLESRRWR